MFLSIPLHRLGFQGFTRPLHRPLHLCRYLFMVGVCWPTLALGTGDVGQTRGGFAHYRQAKSDESLWGKILTATESIVPEPTWHQAVRDSLKGWYGGKGQGPEKALQLRRLYQNRDFQPLWLGRGGYGPAVQEVLQVLKNAAHEGLQPEDYRAAVELIEKTPLQTDDPKQLAHLERTLTAAVLDYIDDLSGERLTPHQVNGQLYIKPTHIDAGFVLEVGLSKDQSGRFLKDLTIRIGDYPRLKQELARLHALQQGDGWPTTLALPKGQKKLTLGDRGAAISTLRQQLAATGFLKGDSAAPDVFDETVLSAVKMYQKYHALEDDGIVGAETIAALNTPLSARIDQVKVTMERWRWVPDPLPRRLVMVNIAGYRLQGIEDGRVTLDMPVIIGQKYRKTPVFTSDIDFVRYNPSWHVPVSIAVKDKLPLIQQDPGYLDRKGFVVTDLDGQRVDGHGVDWSSLGSGHFPYRLRQNPGAQNALGKIFFHINSPFAIFLHSTPDQDLFQKTKRSLSSGCIRVARPADLAFFVLNDPSTWTLQTINAAMEGTKTQDVKPRDKMPVYIGYFTVYVDGDGQIVYGEDLYGQDKAILSALKGRSDSRKKPDTGKPPR